MFSTKALFSLYSIFWLILLTFKSRVGHQIHSVVNLNELEVVFYNLNELLWSLLASLTYTVEEMLLTALWHLSQFEA